MRGVVFGAPVAKSVWGVAFDCFEARLVPSTSLGVLAQNARFESGFGPS